MENLLWRKCIKVIGCKEQVYVRQRRSLLIQMMQNMYPLIRQSPMTYVESGSRAEGLNFEGSDLDCMFVYHGISVLPLSYPMCQQAELIMDTENVKPGFALLRVTDKLRHLLTGHWLSSCISLVDNSYFLSSLLYRESILKENQTWSSNVFLHGPCCTDVSITQVERDMLCCFHCKIWPDKASEWKERRRPNNWPAGELIQDIVNEGCLLVPIGNPFSERCQLEWRISFSLAEKKLVHSMNHTQILCYGMLKLFLKHGVEIDSDLKGILCSYFLKTCLFYAIEDDNVIWHISNIGNCFKQCFFRLRDYVKDGYCPNYFIKGNNMFEGKLNGQKQSKLLQHLSFLCDSVLDIFFSQLCCETNPADLQKESELVTDSEVFDCQRYNSISTSLKFGTAIFLVNMLESSSRVTQPLDHMYLNRYLHLNRLKLSQILYQHFIENMASNKKKYKLVKLIQNILHTCYGYDISTMLLYYATLCYNTGQFSSVISIVNYVLDKFKPYTFYLGLERSLCDRNAYMREICGRGLSYKHKIAQAISFPYQICTQSCMYACDIKAEVNLHSHNGVTTIAPVVYSNVLLLLSYKGLGDTMHSYQALNALKTAARSDRFITELERPLALALHDKCVRLHNE